LFSRFGSAIPKKYMYTIPTNLNPNPNLNPNVSTATVARICTMDFRNSGPSESGSSRATAGPGKTFSRGPQTFSRGPSEEKIFEFSFFKWYTLAYFFKFLDDGGPPKRRGARGS